MNRSLTAFTLTCLVFAGCAKKDKEAEVEPVVPVQVAEVQRDSIQRLVTADAILYPVNQASIMPKISAPVKSFSVNRGDHVRQGQVVAVLENRDLAASVAENKGNFESAEAAYRTTTAATLPEDLNKAHQDVDSGRQALEASQKLYESRKQLFEQGALARRLVDEANVAYAQAKSQYEIARKHLEALESVSRHEQVKNAAAQVESARAKYEGAQAQLSYSEIRSPISGVVTDRPLYAGEMASTGAPLMTVMDTSRVVARANVPVSQAAFVTVGNRATITQGDTSIQAQGKVTVVSAAVDPNSTTVEVWVQADNPGERLKPGSTIRISVLAETISDAIVIPANALLPSQQGGVSVMVVGSDSVAHERKLELGVRELEKLQVLKGLQPGEKVVVVGGVGLEDGAKVRIQKPGEKDEDEKSDKPGKAEKSDKSADKE
jgi:multidrug efflux pump subunit AcrA (membrane-fusion protein)